MGAVGCARHFLLRRRCATSTDEARALRPYLLQTRKLLPDSVSPRGGDLLPRKLRLIERRIRPTRRQQALMPAALHDPPVV